jgi:exosome complex RNA-binding protein Rrp42 (RNase PH superfamily)
MKILLIDVIPLESLGIMPGRFAWKLCVDIVVLADHGNLLDVISLAICSAMEGTRLPQLRPLQSQAGFDDDFVLDASIEHCRGLEGIETPICVTFTLVGEVFILDALKDEEATSLNSVTISVSPSGRFCGSFQSGNIPVSRAQLNSLVDCAVHVAAALSRNSRASAAQLGPRNRLSDSGPDVCLTGLGFLGS